MANSTRKRAQLQAERLAAAKKARRRRLWTAIFCVAVVVAAVVFIVWWLNRPDNKPSPGPTAANPATVTVTPPNASADGKGILANPTATAPAHTLVVFSDYQCSACMTVETLLAPVFQAVPGSTTTQLQFRNRDFLDEDPNHGNWSRPASIASACADTVGTFLPFHMAIYQHYGGLSDTVLRETIPQEIGLTGAALSQFQQCYDTQATAGFVDAMEQAAAADMYNAGFTGTPTLVLDGAKLDVSTWAAADGSVDLAKAKAALGLA